ncbi:hypothetical protein [Streptomyces sp. NPDC014623]|uniref:hypothetical protein n=1 Tax=Streptomyces sp. NPDC014623 TaxID=3364875 RepID=UPI0036F7C415
MGGGREGVGDVLQGQFAEPATEVPEGGKVVEEAGGEGIPAPAVSARATGGSGTVTRKPPRGVRAPRPSAVATRRHHRTRSRAGRLAVPVTPMTLWKMSNAVE